jgi:DNA-binding CsgD family transcriptional regulator
MTISTAPNLQLTEREVDVLRLIALGHTNAEIAGRLHRSLRTVETHRALVQAKLRVSSRAQLVRYALEHGFVEIPAPPRTAQMTARVSYVTRWALPGPRRAVSHTAAVLALGRHRRRDDCGPPR